VKIYEFLFSLLLVTASYHFNQQASISLATATIVPLRSLWRLELEVVFRAIPGLFFIILNIATQSVLASGYLVVNFGPSIPVLQGLLALCFLVPSLTVMIPMERNTFPLWCFMLLSLHIALVVWINFSLVLNTFYILWCSFKRKIIDLFISSSFMDIDPIVNII
jgi:hypothetical protein